MEIFEKIREYRDRPGPGVTGPPPESGSARYFFLFRTHFWRLIKLSLLVFLLSIPIVTAPAAIAGGTHVLMKIVRTGNCFFWDDFWEDFKHDFIKRTPVGLMFFTLPALAYMIASSMNRLALASGLGIGFGIVTFPVACYWYSLITTIDTSVSANVKNAFYLTFLEWKASLKMELLYLVYLAGVFFLPFTIPLFLFFLFGFLHLCACIIIWPVLRRRVVKDGSQSAENAPRGGTGNVKNVDS